MKSRFLILALLFGGACSDGFQKFAPPANSISGRGGKVHPKILTSTPSNGSTVSPVTGINGSRIVVIFDMTMKTDMTPVINTWVREVEGNSIVWYPVANSGATFSWSSTNYLNDTLTIQLGWVRWPENNIIGFDFDNNTLVNLDNMTLDNADKISFTVGWNPGRYKVVPTGQYPCYRYSTSTPIAWTLEEGCQDSTNGGSGGIIGSQNYPAGQNGFIEPRNPIYGSTLYGVSSGGYVQGRRFKKGGNPMNLIPANCTGSPTQQGCNPFTIDSTTNLVWRTCSQGQYYADTMYVGGGELCTPAAGSDFTWGDAVNACSSLNTAEGGMGYGGRRDWRLPTIEELEHLPDYGVRVKKSGTSGEPAPGYPEGAAIDGYQEDQFTFVWEGAFPVTPITKGYWTATGIAATISGSVQYSNALVVEFKKGGMGAGGGSGSLLESHRRPTNRKKVRCVAGPTVEPVAQSLVPGVSGQGAAMTGIGASFWGYDNDALFHVKSTVPAFDVETSNSSVTVTFNRLPNSLQAGVAGNYCIAASTATTCGASLITISTSTQVSGSPKSYRLSLGSAMGANTAYKLFVTGVQSQSDLWLTGQAYTVNTYLYDSGNVYRVAIAHTSTTVAADVGSGNLVLLPTFTPATFYATSTKIYVPATQQVVNVAGGYVSSASATTDITNGLLAVVKDVVTIPVQSLTLQHGLFNGIQPRTTTPPATTVFNLLSATAPNTSTVQVTFSRLPDNSAFAATTPGNYKIISAASSAVFGSASVAAITGVTLSGYTATLSTTLTPSTAYTVVTQNITFSGAQVVDDTVNKLRWQRCRKGTFDIGTCTDDGDATNDSVYWNDALNYCDSLNAIRYDNAAATSTSVRYAWRAPTLNELRSIADRSIFATTGAAISITTFPTPNVLAEDYASSTNYTLNGDPDQSGATPPNFNQAWGFNFISSFTSIVQKDNSTLIPGLKPPKKNIRCVRGLP